MINHYGNQIENEIFWSGLFSGWEGVSMKIWNELSNYSENIIDVGANTGIYSLVSASRNSDAHIVAFEPVQRVYQKLKFNIELNNFKNVTPVNFALSNYTGQGVVYDPESEHVLSVSVNVNLLDKSSSFRKTAIDVVRLDEWFQKSQLKGIDLMKIDVEYHEPQVLQGMGGLLKKYKPSILIEVLTGEVAEIVNSYVMGLGYGVYNIDESTGLRQIPRVEKSSGFNILLINEKHKNLIDKDLLHSI